MGHSLESMVIRHTFRLPFPTGPVGNGGVAARQFDAALMSVGFKLSADLLERLSGLSEGTVVDTAVDTLRTVREMVGDHVQHNVYFIDFPANVPDTCDFWAQCIIEALADEASRESTLEQLSSGVVDLLTLPSYGNYPHTYREMLAAQDELIAAAGDRMTVLHTGDPLADEITALYLALAGSTTPLGDDDLEDLRALAAHCVHGPQPEAIPIRENRALVNQARLGVGADLLVDTVTDVLRLACALSDGDVTLQEPTRFKNLSRPVRRALLAGLDGVVAAAPAKLADVHAHREPFKRLGERLHPHEYPRWPHAAQVFAVARGEQQARSLDSRAEELFGMHDVTGAAELLRAAPGKLFRSLDRLLRMCLTQDEREAVVAVAEQVADRVSGRVLLSVREHLHNRPEETGERRVFVNRLGRAWVTSDERQPVLPDERKRLISALDAEIRRRLPAPEHLLIDPDVLDVALPLSGKATASGLGVLPRGSLSPVDGELLRFFVYWKQTDRSTDYDLSALMLNADYSTRCWLSYTALTEVEGEHSGDITDAPDGASEFINLRLGAVRGTFIVPQVNIFAGEGFEEVEESFFGFMLRETAQQGRPFEPRTVRLKSELRGPGKVALPLAFLRGDDGRWRAKWLHLHLTGNPAANRVEGNRVSVATLLRGIVEREYLTVRYLVDLMTGGTTTVTLWDGSSLPDGPVTYLGLERPEGLHPDSRILTPENLRDLIPA
ncbi:TerD family protein [Streptomyces lydicus]|uniref:TerD family protein n=1 Tax=Streptomyces lydicus TaxID=47763 RepID=UPI0005241CA5|nr:TerD family protein [Streptomyces lydicus]MDC7340707.1 TerD family protein [Streptomyces lydicus]UEG89591.1 TerD family protein [Streptomyces lydicus]